MRSLSALRAAAPLAQPGRSGSLLGVAVQAVGMGRIDAEGLHLVREELQVLQRQRPLVLIGRRGHVHGTHFNDDFHLDEVFGFALVGARNGHRVAWFAGDGDGNEVGPPE